MSATCGFPTPSSIISEDHVVASCLICWFVFTVVTPCTYVIGAFWIRECKGSGKDKTVVRPGWNWGVRGGMRSLVFQALSMGAWIGGFAVMMPMLARKRGIWPHSTAMELLTGAAACGAVSSVLFQIASLLVFDPGSRPMRIFKDFQEHSKDVLWDVRKLPSPAVASRVAVGLGTMWAALGVAHMHLAMYVLTDPTTRVAYLAMGACCLTLAVFVTYGLAGHLRHVPRSTSFPPGVPEDEAPAAEEAGGWHFFQPFKGGGWFVASQALGWALFSSGLTMVAYLMRQGAAEVIHGFRRYASTASTIMLTAQVILASSLLLYRGPTRTIELVRTLSASLAEQGQPENLKSRCTRVLTIIILYAPVHVLCTIISLYFLVLPAHIGATLLVASLFVYYCVAYVAGPSADSGRREWPAFRDWLGSNAERVLPQWLGSLEVIRDGPGELYDADKRYIFGYTAHGLYPLGAGYLPLLPTFRDLFPGISPVPLAASVVFVVPVLRDILEWLGLRAVTRRSFVRALREKGAVLLVPGGQAELVHSHRITSAREFCVYQSHKGFIRLAIQNRAALVPVLVLGELDSMYNLITIPFMLRWSYKKLGFPIPYVIVGRWKVSPFPLPTGVRFVIGKPIDPPKLKNGEAAAEAEVDALHEAFYSSVEDLFARYAPTFPGYEDVKLVRVQR